MWARRHRRPLPDLPRLEVLEGLLRSPQPVYCSGMARARRLLNDARSPIFARAWRAGGEVEPGELARRTREALASRPR